MSVNFTGNVATDFPATTSPGVVVLPFQTGDTHPVIAPDLAPIIKVSGFDLSALRVSYTASNDTLSIGIEQPLSQQPTHPGPVIAGDADNNGNDGTVSDAVLALRPSFLDEQNYGGSEHMAVFLDLKGAGSASNDHADVLAGYATNDPRALKEYQVAQAVVNPNGSGPAFEPDFGAELPQYEGNVYKNNSTVHPNLEFDIKNFSQLYLNETGKTLTASSQIGIGGFAGSGEDLGVGEAFMHEQKFSLGSATIPPTTCPPVSPPVIINPHENRHINTAHDTKIRVNIIGSSGFDVTKIDPSTVRLGGASPIFGFDRYINQDDWLDATYVFRGTDVTLPSGFTEATVTGKLTDGTSFSSSVKVFNRDASFYTPAQNAVAAQQRLARATRQNGFTVLPPTMAGSVATASTPQAASPVKVDYSTPQSSQTQKGPVVSIKRRDAAAVTTSSRISTRMQSNLNRLARGLGNVNTSQTASAV